MDAGTALRGLMTAIDERRWSDLSDYLHPDLVCRLVHTGETFSRDQWIALNAEYPGFDRLRVEEFVGGASAAACRSHVTSRTSDGIQHFECASFAQVQDGLISRLTEVWTDTDQKPPEGARPENDGETRA
ncbi:nuclear transport factor 2 family protein [Leucobacter zeae]|nr:nuclear transport factor 2 family protein [Leucobacter zeae]